MTDTVVVEGHVKCRDGKKWKSRWVVLRKPSPVADCLSLLVYKEKKKGKERGGGHKERLSVTLEGICGVEPGLGYDGVSYTFSILCLTRTVILGFKSRDTLMTWDARVRYSLGEVHRFSVDVEPGTKLERGPASLHLCNNLLVLTRDVPPVVIGHWKLSALRRYGAVPNGFVFEGGSRCGCWAGVFVLSCSEGEQISFLFDCIVRGVNPSRTPHGLQPILPDPGADPVSTEERINQEATELEKRLSMLSQCSLASSTASSYSCSTSVAGDDQSSISSSSSNQSDVSFGSRHPYWVEPSARSHVLSEAASGSSSTRKALTGSEDRLFATVTGGTGAPSSSVLLHPRGLSDSGRQSSLDSGIGTATGSQSSYSGSFSSCTESLDSQGAAEELGCLASRPSSPPPPPPQSTLLFSPRVHEHSSATSTACPCASRSSSCASLRHSEEYLTPGQLRPRYDTPRSLLQSPPRREPPAQGGPTGPGRDRRSIPDAGGSQGQRSNGSTLGDEGAASGDPERWPTLRPPPAPRGLVGEVQYDRGSDNYITPEQWHSVRNRCLTQITSSPSGPSPAVDTPDPPPCVREGDDGGDDLLGVRWSTPSLQTAAAPPLPAALSAFRTTDGTFQPSRSTVSLDIQRHGDDADNYVNLPVSLLPARDEGSNRYTHLDFSMESRQSVGTECVEGRENRRRGPPK
ncbi:protein Dok-7 [Antennarius striatus]|uniref:protein Dok-7 n=1 Tax=Antennarius striatus TaxID=241820 RepID=UPI0035B34190